MSNVVVIHQPRITAERKHVKNQSCEVIEINSPITRKVPVTDVLIECVRLQIVLKWKRGKRTRALAAEYGIPRESVEDIVFEIISKSFSPSLRVA